ncbi:MAG TPA: inositol monophosphatase [Bryobacteraceae bacterium]|nr:inositol monophosphatase [Bryobacteraceae bacterium]
MAFEREIELAKLLAQEAGALAIDYQRRGVEAEIKADESPVTAADRACEKLIVDRITLEFPEDGVLGEEGGRRQSRSGRQWIIDPIDGTRDFLRAIPLWAVLIGLEQDGEVVAGVAHCPRQGLLLWAAKGEGAWADGSRIHVSNKSEPGDAVLAFNGFHKEGVRHLANRIVPWVQQFWAVRSLGGAVDAMLVAQGKADIWIEPNGAAWDLAPFKILIEEAGGRFASFDGESTIYGGNAYACAPGMETSVKQFLG